MEVGDLVELDIDRVAHGGHCVGRFEGRAVFVRHTAPGERVRAEVTKIGKGGRLAFADAIEVLRPSLHRIPAPCKYAGECGGCDFQHLELGYQRQLKAEVLREQLTRLGGLASTHPVLAAEVKPLSSDETGLGWRQRVRYATDRRGRIGFRRHAGHELVAIERCLVAAAGIDGGPLVNRPWAADSEVIAARTADGALQVQSIAAERVVLTERVAGREFAVAADGFWQSHELAAERFTESVLRLAAPQPGHHILDLYAGVGLFSLPLAAAVGPGGRVDAVEGDKFGAKLLARNLREQPQAQPVAAEVGSWLRQTRLRRCDTVVLDPPRTGAGAQVLQGISRLEPAAIVYVACDPAALARDVKTLAELGYELVEIEVWDAFPMTQHFETIAKFRPARMPHQLGSN